MLFYGCLYIGVSGPLIQYLKMFNKCSHGAELQPLRASPQLSTNAPFLEVGQGGGWGCGPEQLAATVPFASAYSGCIAMLRRTQLLAVFCKYCRTLRVLRWKSWSSISKGYHIIYRLDIYILYIIMAESRVRLQKI